METVTKDHVRNPGQVAESQAKTIATYGKIVDLMGVNKPVATSSSEMAETLGYTQGEFRRRLQVFVSIGLMRLEKSYEWQRTISTYTVLKTKEAGQQFLREWFAAGHQLREYEGASKQPGYRRNKATPPAETHDETAVRYDHDEPVEAITGPDAPSPMETLRAIRKDEPQALIESARQYANRKTAVISKFEELEALGIKIDREKVLSGIEVQEDPYFEGITKLLPYIAELEAKVSQVGDWKAELTEKRRENGQLRDMYNREKDANKRLSDRMAQLRQAMGGNATDYAAN